MKTPSDVLIINSYAGSLTIAASQLGLPIRGSYEDCGFGLPVQRANFPALNYVERPPWPKDHLQHSLVIAHPPCAAFSTQSPYRKGIDSDHFLPHKMVMDYALSQGTPALAIESVPGILAGGRQVHEEFAKKYKYHVYYIHQNAVTFGVPQWRPRVWTIFTKLPQLILHHHPEVRRIRDILLARGTRLEPNSEIKGAVKCLISAGFTEKRIYKELLSGEHIGSLLQIGKKILEIDDAGQNYEEVRKRWNLGGRFGVKMPRVLNPEEFGTTILHDSSFFVMGRQLFLEEYCALMGFPADYKWPGKTLRDFRLYLSKGVCPPVAKWILEMMVLNVSKTIKLSDLDSVSNMVRVVKPGEIADFTVTKKQVKQGRLF